MNRLREKTTATLLIAIFMISTITVSFAVPSTLTYELSAKEGVAEWSTEKHAVDAYSIHLQTTGTVGTGSEARITITMPSGFTLGDLKTLSWRIFSVSGYPAHVDITLDTPGDLQSMLTAELAVNNPAYDPITPVRGTYDIWLKTFEMAANDGYGVIDDNTVLWVTKMGAGDEDAPSSTLASWKANTVDSDPFGELPSGTAINSDIPVLKLEIEVDNWIVQTEAYIDDFVLNGITYPVEPSGAVGMTSSVDVPTISISVTPTDINFGRVVAGKSSALHLITIDNTGEASVDVTAEVLEDGTFYVDCLTLKGGLVSALDETIAFNGETSFNARLVVPRDYEVGSYAGILVFWAEETPQ